MRKIQVVLCGAHRWDGREYTIRQDELSKPIPVDVELPAEAVRSGEAPQTREPDRFVWDGTVDYNGRHRFRIPAVPA